MSDITKLGAFNQAIGAGLALVAVGLGVSPLVVGIAAAVLAVSALPAVKRTIQFRFKTGMTIG